VPYAARSDADLEDAIERALASPLPAPEEALEDMFASG
jgi:hypothetical protein